MDLTLAARIITAPYVSTSPASRIKQRLVGFVEGKHQNEFSEPRKPGFHISGLAGVCARQAAMIHVAALKTGGQYPAKVFLEFEHYKKVVKDQGLEIPNLPTSSFDLAGSAMTCDLGHMIHQWYQENYFGRAQQMMGLWRCDRCEWVYEGFMPMTCDRDVPIAIHQNSGIKTGWGPCNGTWRNMRYEEYGVDIEISSLSFTGHVDGVWIDPEWGIAREFVLEFKTLSSYKFGDLKKPVYEHVVQVHGYMKGLGIKEAVIMYIDRGKQCEWDFRTGSPMPGDVRIKTYHIKWDDELWKTIKDQTSDFAEVLNIIAEEDDYWRDSEGNIRSVEDVAKDWVPVCDIKSCATAQKCPVRGECFDV